MRTIPLTKGKYAVVDDWNYERLSKFSWFAMKKGNVWYAARQWTIRPNLAKTVYMHQDVFPGPSGTIRDHIDGNGLNNQISNLRLATQSQNAANTKFTKRDSGIRFKGVYKSRKGQWQAAVRFNGKLHYLGQFQTDLEAAQAYDKAAKIFHGEFAVLNF